MATQKELELLRQAWREGFARPDGLQLVFTNAQAARRMRFALYGAVREIRQGKLQADDALQMAVDECEIVNEAKGTRLLIRNRMKGESLQVVQAALGASGQTTDEKVAEESAKRVVERLEKEGLVGDGKPRQTPYYTREG